MAAGQRAHRAMSFVRLCQRGKIMTANGHNPPFGGSPGSGPGQRGPWAPRLGITVNMCADQGLAADFAGLGGFLTELAQAGFTHVELGAQRLGMHAGGRVQPARIAVLTGALGDSPLRLTLHSCWSGSGRLGNLVDTASASGQRAGLLADLETARAIGAEVLVVHAGVLLNQYGDGDALAAGMAAEREELRRLADQAGEAGIMVAVENRAPTPAVIAHRSYGLDPRQVAEQVAAVSHPQVTMCLDTGHAFLAARYLHHDFLSAVRDVAPVVGHIHLSDNFGRVPPVPSPEPHEMEVLGEGDLHLPPGWGTLPLAEVMAVTYPLDPIVIVEIRYVRHYAEAMTTMRQLLAERTYA
jgi:sugar phosphate isomerase/epimerase